MHNSLSFRSTNLQFLVILLLFMVHLGQSFQQSPVITTLQELRLGQEKSSTQSMEAVAKGLSLKMEEISKQIENAVTQLSTQVHGHVTTAIHGLKGVAQVINDSNITPGVSEELDHSIQDAIANLDTTANVLGHSLDNDVSSMSVVTSETLRISTAAARDIKAAVENAVAQGKLHKEGKDQLMKIINDLIDSIDRSLQEFGKPIRNIADRIAVISSQYQTHFTDIKEVPEPVKLELVQAGRDLSNNWAAFIKITELTGAGNASAERVSKALDNIHNLNCILLEKEDLSSTKTPVPSQGFKGRVDVSVLLIALIISLKGCRKWVN